LLQNQKLSQLVRRPDMSASHYSYSKQVVKHFDFGEAPASVSNTKLVTHAVLMHLELPDLFH